MTRHAPNARRADRPVDHTHGPSQKNSDSGRIADDFGGSGSAGVTCPLAGGRQRIPRIELKWSSWTPMSAEIKNGPCPRCSPFECRVQVMKPGRNIEPAGPYLGQTTEPISASREPTSRLSCRPTQGRTR